MDDTLDDIARIIGCTPANVADRVEEILRDNRDLLMERHGLRSEGLKLAEENERLRQERDEARAEVERLRDGFAILASSLEARCRQADDARSEVERLTAIDRALASGGDYVRQLVASYRASALGAQKLEELATKKLLALSEQHEDLRRELASRDRENLDLRAQLDEAALNARRR